MTFFCTVSLRASGLNYRWHSSLRNENSVSNGVQYLLDLSVAFKEHKCIFQCKQAGKVEDFIFNFDQIANLNVTNPHQVSFIFRRRQWPEPAGHARKTQLPEKTQLLKAQEMRKGEFRRKLSCPNVLWGGEVSPKFGSKLSKYLTQRGDRFNPIGTSK